MQQPGSAPCWCIAAAATGEPGGLPFPTPRPMVPATVDQAPARPPHRLVGRAGNRLPPRAPGQDRHPPARLRLDPEPNLQRERSRADSATATAAHKAGPAPVAGGAGVADSGLSGVAGAGPAASGQQSEYPDLVDAGISTARASSDRRAFGGARRSRPGGSQALRPAGCVRGCAGSSGSGWPG